MPLRVVGAGLGRTGTHSLKIALEQLLGAPCYHMVEVLANPPFATYWQDAIDGKPVDWDVVMDGYAAAVDWPAAAFWRELAEQYPDAIILLSTRSSADAWWKSANATIFDISRADGAARLADARADEDGEGDARRRRSRRTGPTRPKPSARTSNTTRPCARSAAPDRLVDWQPGDGWEPICRALNSPFPTSRSRTSTPPTSSAPCSA